MILAYLAAATLSLVFTKYGYMLATVKFMFLALKGLLWLMALIATCLFLWRRRPKPRMLPR